MTAVVVRTAPIPQMRVRVLAALICPRFAYRCPSNEGAGNAGCALHPRSRVRSCAKKLHTSHTGQRRTSDIPCARKSMGGESLVRSRQWGCCVQFCVTSRCHQAAERNIAACEVLWSSFTLAMVAYQQKITFGELREDSGVRDVLTVATIAARTMSRQMPMARLTNIRLSDIEPKFICTRCGRARRRHPAEVSGGADGDGSEPSRCYPFTLRCLCYDTSLDLRDPSRPAMGWPPAAVPVRPTRAATRPLTSRRACRRVQADG